ncbi:putative ABC transporter ATP-binding protein/MT1014 [Thalassoglobus neptunius]|uniref:Putative ABC transporter ATP-binding protein/MT1014 n=1 Tax=Thalassoglobus neptunius TaxID=1938619 RepID=A0A5C5VY51_9PLAN|nr:ABC transporter ATP-binding protein [Thalassoglobus neptunius]TWT43556.1 putative ABC transporter ATP-binding protein/MT1014 [Thalassoglobus neptunius]
MNDSAHPLPLIVDNVSRAFSRGGSPVEALREVNLEVKYGEFIAIMGASGSGKSTLLHAAAGLTRVDAGRIVISGQDISELSDSRLTKFRRKHLGIVFQSFNLIPTLSAEDNVRLPSSLDEHQDDQVDALLDRLGILDRRKHMPGAMSGGEQQRVAIARALVCQPDLLLADEPTGSLDSVTGQEICKLLRQLCDEEQRTILLVTHEPNVAMWADRIVVLRDGTNLSEFKTPDRHDPLEVAHQYQSLLTVGSC